MGHAQAAGETRDGFRPRESIPIKYCRLARNNRRCFVPRSPLQGVTRLYGHQVECGFESWFQSRGRSQALDLNRRRSIVAFLQIRVDQIFDRMTELVPNKLTFV